MTTEQQQEQASLYAAGAMTAHEQRAFEEQLAINGELREITRGLLAAAGLLAKATKPAPLPVDLKQKVLRRIETEAGMNAHPVEPRAAQSTSPGFLFHAAVDSQGWKELLLRGAWIKLLSLEPARGYAVLLGKLEAGVRYPAHTHEGSEDIYVLSGDLHIGDYTMGPGDFHHADAGTSHPVNYSVQGCTLMAILPADHELVRFAMG